MIELEGQKYSGYASAEKADRVSLMLLLAEAIIFAAGANGIRFCDPIVESVVDRRRYENGTHIHDDEHWSNLYAVMSEGVFYSGEDRIRYNEYILNPAKTVDGYSDAFLTISGVPIADSEEDEEQIFRFFGERVLPGGRLENPDPNTWNVEDEYKILLFCATLFGCEKKIKALLEPIDAC